MPVSLSDLLNALRARRSLAGPVLALGLRGSGALLSIGIFTLAARIMAPADFGRLAMWFSALSIFAVAAVHGQDTLIARSWGEYCGRGDRATARAAYRYGWGMTLAGGAVAAAALLFCGGAALDMPPAVARAGAAFLFMQTALHYSSSATRVIAGFVVSESNRDATWRVILMLGVAVAGLAGELSAAAFFWIAAAGMAPAVAFQFVAARRALPPVDSPPPAENRPAWRARSRAMWASAVIEAASQHADVMLIGALASPVVAGDYFVAARIAGVFPMLMSGLGAYAAAHGANLYFSGRLRELQAMFRAIVTVALALAAPAYVAILLFGRQILSLFGEHFVATYPTLLVLSSAIFVVAMCGLAPGVLLLTGLETLYSRIIALATAARIALSAVLAIAFGSVGAAFGWALVGAPVAIALAVLCRRMRGVDPSVYCLVAPPRGATAAKERERSNRIVESAVSSCGGSVTRHADEPAELR